MAASEFERYAVREPVAESFPEVKNRQSPLTYMSGKQVPGAQCYVQLGWITGVPDPNPHVAEHVHDFDQVLHYWGGNPETPQVLGGEIEIYIGGQPVKFNTTTCIYIPGGTPHGPITWKGFQFPHMEMILVPGNGDPVDSLKKAVAAGPVKEVPKKTEKFDYEQYVIRSPMREAAIGFRGLQSPSMTYLSRVQINTVNHYIDWAWVYDIVQPEIGEHVHHNNEEVVLHIGGDPSDPEDLGADMEYGIGGDILKFSKSYAAFLPRGLRHGPLRWQRVREPHLEMAIVFGVGTFAERAAGSAKVGEGTY
jgi:hypothetical protein